MDTVLFNSIALKLEAYFQEAGRGKYTGGKEKTPMKFLLAGVLRWIAGGSTHDIIYFCGMRLRYIILYILKFIFLN